MRTVGLVLLAFAVVLGGIAVWGLRSISGAHAQPAPPAAVAASQLVVAARPIAAGERLVPAALKLQAWPAGAHPAGAFAAIGQAAAGAPIALTAIAANEPILKNRISGPGARPTLSGVIQPGMRAASIRVDDVMGVAGFVLPGDFVDVLVTRTEGAASAESLRTDVLFEGVRVLAVDQVSSQGKDEPVLAKAATIELTPEQAQKLALARQVGTVSLALRGTADPVGGTRRGAVRVADLGLGGPPRVASTRAPVRRTVRAPGGPSMQIYRGGAEATVAVRAE
jgi:pilus assembly protein CpaB